MEFNSLPLEIHLEIFSHLPVHDVMSIRRVCRLWNGLINGEFKFKRLRCRQLRGPDRGRSFQPNDFVFTSTRSFLDYTSTDPKFSRVRYLDANLIPKAGNLEDAFDFLNSFKSLRETSFSVYEHGRHAAADVQKQFVISLHHLEKARFHFGYGTRGSIASVLLDLPSLRSLSINSLASITIGRPDKLVALATNNLFGSQLDHSLFTSLTTIFTKASDASSISAGFLEKLPSLSELHLAYGSLPLDYRLPEPSSDKARPKIFYFGFEVSAREIESEGAQWPHSISYDLTDASARFIARNLHRSIDDNLHVYSIDYNAIAGQLDDSEMFGVMRRKLSKIRFLRIRGTVIDENRLLKFIDKFRFTQAAFERTSLPQRFFEQLAENCPFISDLEINSEPTKSILSGDFDFVFKFHNLSRLRFSDSPLSLNFVARALKELKFNFSGYDIPANEEAADWIIALQRQLNADAAVCPGQLQVLLGRLKFEKENALFWTRKYLYDHLHSICLSEQQMRLLNLRC